MTNTLSIGAAGMVTAVGLDCVSSCAAMRGRLDGFQETRFQGSGGEWQLGAPVPLPRNWIGVKRLAHLAAGALHDIYRKVPEARADAALILCLAEPERPGNLTGDGAQLAKLILQILDLPPRTDVRVIAHGRPSGLVALEQARRMLSSGDAKRILIVGVDSYLTSPTIAHYLVEERLVTPKNANGFIPAEAAAAVLVEPGDDGPLLLTGLGLAREQAFIYNRSDDEGLDIPLRADGMTAAYRAALDEAGGNLADIEYRISDLIGEKFFFMQAAITSMRLQRGRREFVDLWSPAESLGNVGSAVVPLMVGMALQAARKGYAMGSPVLIEASGDDGACGAAVLHETALAVWRRAA